MTKGKREEEMEKGLIKKRKKEGVKGKRRRGNSPKNKEIRRIGVRVQRNTKKRCQSK